MVKVVFSDDDLQNILKLEQKAKDIKNSWDNLYNKVIQYIMPFKSYSGTSDTEKGPYESKDVKLFNSLGQTCANKFVNNIQNMLTPVDTDFIGFETGYYYKNKNEEKEKADRDLERLAQNLNDLKSISNFDIAISEFYYDLIFGTACLLTYSGNIMEPIKFKAVSFKDYCFLEGGDGAIDIVFRNFKIKKEEVKNYWKDINEGVYNKLTENINNETEEVDFLEVCKYNYELEQWDYLVINRDNKLVLVQRVYENNPFIILRWNKGSNEIYGRGVGLLALNDLKTFNKIMENSMQMLSYQIPILLADDSDVLRDDFDLETGKVHFTRFDNGKPNLQQLQIKSDFNITQFNMESIKMDVSKTMMSNALPDYTQARTTSEINARLQEIHINYVSVFGRLIKKINNGKSPDYMDSLALTFAKPVVKRNEFINNTIRFKRV